MYEESINNNASIIILQRPDYNLLRNLQSVGLGNRVRFRHHGAGGYMELY